MQKNALSQLLKQLNFNLLRQSNVSQTAFLLSNQLTPP